MTQKFYFHDSLSPNTGILPGLTVLWPGTLASTAPGAPVNRHMDGTRGSNQASVFTNINSGSSGVSWSRRFLSPPLAAKNVPSGLWYFQLAGFVNLLGDQPTLALSISLWRPSTGAVVLQNFTTPSSTTALTTSPTVVVGPISDDVQANAFSIQAGDILVVEVLASAAAIATIINTTQYDGLYEGNAQSEASFLQPPCDLPLLQPSPSGPYAISQETGDRLALETDSIQGVLIAESAIPEFHSFSLEEGNANFQLEDGSGVLLGENQLFYAIDIEGTISDRISLEDGTGVLISEEQETIWTIFRGIGVEVVASSIAKFYLHDATSGDAGTMPGGTNLAGVAIVGSDTGASTNRAMDGTIGSSQASSTVTVAGSSWWFRRFVTPPLAAQSVAAGNWLIHLAASSSSAGTSGANIDVFIGQYRPSTGALIATIFPEAPGTSGLGVPLSSSETAKTSVALAGSAFTLLDGDILVLEIFGLDALA